MAAHLRRQVLSLPHLLRLSSSEISGTRSLTTDAVVELKPGEIGMVSGIPQEHLRRKVVIYSPARTATQQGSGKVGRWKINFMSTHKWENPLMGWTSTGDPYANVGDAGLSFDSAEAAASFAEKHGWDYVEVEELKKKKMENRNRKTIRKAQVDKKESPSNLVISLSQITVTRPQPNKFLTKKFRLRSVTHHF